MDIIDSHLHLNLNDMTLKKIIKYLDRENIDLCWLLTWEEINHSYWDYRNLSIENAYEAYLKYPLRIIPFYAPDPRRSDAATQLEHWCHKGICGCGELKATLNWSSPEVIKLLQVVSRLKIPVVFHMEEMETRYIQYSDSIFDKLIFSALNTNVRIFRVPRRILQILVNNFTPLRNRTKSYLFPGYMVDFASLEMTLKDYPDTNFIAHGPMFWENMFSNTSTENGQLPQRAYGDSIPWRLLREYPNLYADISGQSGFTALSRNVESSRVFLSLFDDKILYGTDNTMRHQRDFLESLNLDRSALKKIYCDNALKLIRR